MELSAAVQFGDGITFKARLVSPVQIQKASILIHDSTQIIPHVQPVIFNQDGSSEFRFDTRQNVLRPFTTILWRYELTLADGSTVQSATGSIRYDDDRFTWQTLEANSLHVHWYNGDQQFGTAALNAAQSGLQNIPGLLAPNLSQPVDVFIYANESDLRGTLYGAESWVAGHADSAAGVVMVTIEPGADQGIVMEQRIPHELMHVIDGIVGGGFHPHFLDHVGPGSAAPVVGGLWACMFLTLLVLPAAYATWRRWQLASGRIPASAAGGAA